LEILYVFFRTLYAEFLAQAGVSAGAEAILKSFFP